MALLPDWDSIESTTRWSEGLFWAGIFALALVAVTELAAHVYGNRAAYLVFAHDRTVVQDRQAQRRYSAETARLQEKLDSANEETFALHQKLDGANAETAALQQKLDGANAVLQNLESSNARPVGSGSARHLFDRQKNELLKSLAPFAGQKIKVWGSGTARDSISLGREFITVLKMAGWVVPNEALRGPIAGGDTNGIRVVFEGDLSNPSQVPDGIETLIATLQRVGLISSRTLYLDSKARGGEYLLKIGRIPASSRTKG